MVERQYQLLLNLHILAHLDGHLFDHIESIVGIDDGKVKGKIAEEADIARAQVQLKVDQEVEELEAGALLRHRYIQIDVLLDLVVTAVGRDLPRLGRLADKLLWRALG